MDNHTTQESEIKISVVIATFNRRHLLVRTLPTLFQQDFPADDFEIVVVIDGSSDGSAEALADLRPPRRFQVLQQPNQGQGVARNSGIRAAKGEIILFLDDDFLCDSQLLHEHAAGHQVSPGSLVIGRPLLDPGSRPTAAAELCRRYYEANYPAVDFQPHWQIYASVCSNTSLSRSLCLQFGGFDESFSHMAEDVEFGLRLHSADVGISYRPKAVTYEIYEKTPAQLIANSEKWSARNELLLCSKHPAYRSVSQLASRAYWIQPTRWMWRLLAALYPILRFPLNCVSRLLDVFQAIKTLRSFAIRVLVTRMRLAVLSGAVAIAGSWSALGKRFGKALPILLYHQVGPATPGILPALTLDKRKFNGQIGWLLKRKYRPIQAFQWVQWCRKGYSLPDKAVLLTFDDGYSDLCESAFPILQKHGCTAATMVVSSMIGKTNDWETAEGAGAQNLMTTEQIRHWRTNGIEFGSHSRTHADLSGLQLSELLSEIAGSKDDLATIIGTPPCSFAYPYGRFSDSALAVARKTFAMAFTVEEGLNGLSTDLHLLKRSMIQPKETLFEFGLRVRFGRNPLLPIRRILSGAKKIFTGQRS